MKKPQTAKEKKCPECGSEEVGQKGSFLSGPINIIRLECYNCGKEFYIPESVYKP